MGFHQILLEEASRDITTFAVDDGLYRYKGLMFGISCAPELYQHIIRQVLSECKGALNIADDLIAEQHDNLRKLCSTSEKTASRHAWRNVYFGSHQ